MTVKGQGKYFFLLPPFPFLSAFSTVKTFFPSGSALRGVTMHWRLPQPSGFFGNIIASTESSSQSAFQTNNEVSRIHCVISKGTNADFCLERFTLISVLKESKLKSYSCKTCPSLTILITVLNHAIAISV